MHDSAYSLAFIYITSGMVIAFRNAKCILCTDRINLFFAVAAVELMEFLQRNPCSVWNENLEMLIIHNPFNSAWIRCVFFIYHVDTFDNSSQSQSVLYSYFMMTVEQKKIVTLSRKSMWKHVQKRINYAISFSIFHFPFSWCILDACSTAKKIHFKIRWGCSSWYYSNCT